jgi:glycosyltransferase involved in cell wall biosynthesis
MNAPRVSVIMPVYNAQAYLDASVRSILAQTLSDFELICIDDGSTDASLGILRRFEREDARVRVITRPNTGIVGALNDGLAAARGELIARMDADDVSLPTRFAQQVDYLDAHSDVVALGAWVVEVDAYRSPLHERQTPTLHEAIDAAHMAGHGGQIAHPSVMMRAAALRSVGGYRSCCEWAEDLDLFLRLAEVGRLANLPSVLLHYRQHSANVCFTRQKQQRAAIARAIDDAAARRGVIASRLQPTTAGTIAERVRSWALHAIHAGNLGIARRHARMLLREAPLRLDSWRIMYWAIKG